MEVIRIKKEITQKDLQLLYEYSPIFYRMLLDEIRLIEEFLAKKLDRIKTLEKNKK